MSFENVIGFSHHEEPDRAAEGFSTGHYVRACAGTALCQLRFDDLPISFFPTKIFILLKNFFVIRRETPTIVMQNFNILDDFSLLVHKK